jgi:hypothetical protein
MLAAASGAECAGRRTAGDGAGAIPFSVGPRLSERCDIAQQPAVPAGPGATRASQHALGEAVASPEHTRHAAFRA